MQPKNKNERKKKESKYANETDSSEMKTIWRKRKKNNIMNKYIA